MPPLSPPAASRAAIIAPLRHLAMVSFAVPPERVVRFIPSRFDLDLRQDPQGKSYAFVSVVMFLNERAGPVAPGLRFLRATFPQVNYRTYVRNRGVPGAWFFRVVMRSRQADIQRVIFRAPTYSAPIAQRPEWDGERQTYRSYRFDCGAAPHRLEVELAADDRPSSGLLFETPEAMAEWLTMRLDGYFHDPAARQLSHMRVWHEPMRPRPAAVRRFSSEVLDRLGLVPAEEQARPYAAFFQPGIDFYGHYPRRMERESP